VARFHVNEEGNFESRYGDIFRFPGGIVRLEPGQYSHRIGGNSWKFTDYSTQDDPPTLILTLDLADPICHAIEWDQGKELPLCSHLVECHSVDPQFFQIDPKTRTIAVLEFTRALNQPRFPEFLVLPERFVSIYSMTDSDFPATEDLYWSIADEFVGGSKFIRVLGRPYWLQGSQQVFCRCGKEMQPIACMGYANQRTPSPMEELLFFGEAAFYWFFCTNCSILGVITQST